MGVLEADQLQKIIENASSWPIWGANAVGQDTSLAANVYARAGMYGETLRDIGMWVALREADRTKIKQLIDWRGDREYRFDPLPQRICGAYSDLLFGEDPDFTPPNKEDQDQLDELVKANDLPSELRRFCEEVVSEGEGWWRVYCDKDISPDWPVVEFVSRLDTIPLFAGKRILAVGFVTTLFTQQIMVEHQEQTQVFRHIEIQTDGLSRNLLFKGNLNAIGVNVPLSDAGETKDLPPEWNHGLDIMLAGRIPNRLGRDWRLGVSDFVGIKDLLLDLNESHTIMAENARNTAKARMVVPASALDENGKFNAGEDVIVAESMDEALDGGAKSGPYAVLEYMFQAGPLLEHIDNLVTTCLTRVGLAEQFVQTGRGGGNEGAAYTGTGLRTRLIPTTLAASGKGRFWDVGVPDMIKALVQTSALPDEKGGYGKSWKDSEGRFTMKRTSVLPEDQAEETQRHVMAVQGEIESIETAIRATHLDWDDDDIQAEIDRIKKDRAPAVQTSPPGPDGEPASGDQNMAGQGEPASPVPGVDTRGARQPGATGGSQGPDGQSPGRRRPRVAAGGPR